MADAVRFECRMYASKGCRHDGHSLAPARKVPRPSRRYSASITAVRSLSPIAADHAPLYVKQLPEAIDGLFANCGQVEGAANIASNLVELWGVALQLRTVYRR
jgi:hypothetical protein